MEKSKTHQNISSITYSKKTDKPCKYVWICFVHTFIHNYNAVYWTFSPTFLRRKGICVVMLMKSHYCNAGIVKKYNINIWHILIQQVINTQFRSLVINLNLNLQHKQLAPKNWSDITQEHVDGGTQEKLGEFISRHRHIYKSPQVYCCVFVLCDVSVMFWWMFLCLSSALFSVSPRLLLPHKNANTGLKHLAFTVHYAPSLHYNKRINLPGLCKVIGGEGGQHKAELSFPLSVDYIASAPPSRATNHPHSCANTRGKGNRSEAIRAPCSWLT